MELVLLVEVVVREFIVFIKLVEFVLLVEVVVRIHSICKAGGIGTIGRSCSQGFMVFVKLVLLVEVVVREFIVFV